MCVLSHAVQQGHDIRQGDAEAAYLNCETPPGMKIFIWYPDGIPHKDRKGYCIQCMKCIYGINISGAAFYNRYRDTLLLNGFKQYPHIDECLFIRNDIADRNNPKDYMIHNEISEQLYKRNKGAANTMHA